MATLHAAENVLVVRIVYDGPAEAGKTTTLKALGAQLSRTCVSPGTTGERTMFFDWFDYRGGNFDGHPIDCQVVSVPGQSTLRHRRHVLLQSADVVVYVSPSAQQTVEEAVEALELVNRECSQQIGIVCQVNQRDRPEAYSVSELRRRLETVAPNVAVIESIANRGQGVREAFVFAVRLALDRVRELSDAGQLPEGPPEETQASDLLARMLEREAVVKFDRGNTGERGRPISLLQSLHPTDAQPEGSPRLPRSDVDGSCIWPPIEGRIRLSDATSELPALTRSGQAWWCTTTNGWILYTDDARHFSSLELAKKYLRKLARHHVDFRDVLSFPRCLVVSEEVDGGARVWQVVRERLSMRARLTTVFDEQKPRYVAKILVDTAHRLMELEQRLKDLGSGMLRANLDTTGVFSGVTHYVGVFDHGTAANETQPSALQQITEVVRDWHFRREELLDALQSLSTELPDRREALEEVSRQLKDLPQDR